MHERLQRRLIATVAQHAYLEQRGVAPTDLRETRELAAGAGDAGTHQCCSGASVTSTRRSSSPRRPPAAGRLRSVSWRGSRISVVFPTYNERDSIRAAILDFAAIEVVDEIIIVNNNAAAGT